MSQENLIEYHLVDLHAFQPSLRSLQGLAAQQVDDLVRDVGNEPVEFRGPAPLFIAALALAAVYGRTTELTFRDGRDSDATLIFSRLNEVEIIRPQGIVQPPLHMREEIGDDVPLVAIPEKICDLEALWQAAQAQGGDALTVFFGQAAHLCGHVLAVTFQGTIPTLPALLAMRVALDLVPQVSYEEFVLKPYPNE